MTHEQIVEVFKKHENEFLKFENISKNDRLHKRPDLCAMLFLAIFAGDSNSNIVEAAEHDQIWLNVDPEKLPLTEDHILFLRRCGVSYDEKNYGFSMFV